MILIDVTFFENTNGMVEHFCSFSKNDVIPWGSLKDFDFSNSFVYFVREVWLPTAPSWIFVSFIFWQDGFKIKRIEKSIAKMSNSKCLYTKVVILLKKTNCSRNDTAYFRKLCCVVAWGSLRDFDRRPTGSKRSQGRYTSEKKKWCTQ